jgi:tetratricopeptide (TPR) repeat protein
VARADRRRVSRTRAAVAARADAQSRRDRELAAIDDTMFFPKLRRHAKWMFVFLALVFGVGFVVFGIGANQAGTSLGDLLSQSGGDTGVLSVDEARERVEENPKNAEAKLELATALETDGQTNEAITVLGQYVTLRPKDTDALRQLAGLYQTRALEYQRRAADAQTRASYRSVGSTFVEGLKLDETQTLGEDPIDEAVAAVASEEVNAANTVAGEAFRNAMQMYERIVALSPNDPNSQLELAQTAQQAGDYAKAIAAYERFVKLAPDDPTTELVKEQIKQLKQFTNPGSG